MKCLAPSAAIGAECLDEIAMARDVLQAVEVGRTALVIAAGEVVPLARRPVGAESRDQVVMARDVGQRCERRRRRVALQHEVADLVEGGRLQLRLPRHHREIAPSHRAGSIRVDLQQAAPSPVGANRT